MVANHHGDLLLADNHIRWQDEIGITSHPGQIVPSTYCTYLWSHTLAIFLDLLFEDNIVESPAALA